MTSQLKQKTMKKRINNVNGTKKA